LSCFFRKIILFEFPRKQNHFKIVVNSKNRVDLERKIETLHEELDYSRKVRLEEVEDLKQQISEQGVSVEVDGITPDMNQILNEIRKEYDIIALKNRDEAEMWYKVNKWSTNQAFRHV